MHFQLWLKSLLHTNILLSITKQHAAKQVKQTAHSVNMQILPHK